MAAPKPSIQLPWGVKLGAMVVVPCLFFGVIEVALWTAGVEPLAADNDPFEGFSGALEVFEKDEARGVWSTYERATRQSFVPQTFLLNKPDNGYRFFTLGGSAAIGFPHGPDLAFTRLLGDALQAAYPGRKVEAVNAAAMSYASHRLRILAEELLRHEPDAFIFYEGHNEFVERRFYGQAEDLAAAAGALSGWVTHWRLLGMVWRTWQDMRPAQPQGELEVDVVREKSIVATTEQRLEVERGFEENLNALADLAQKAGVRLILCAAPSNARDWRPNQSVLGTELDAPTRDRFVQLTSDAERAYAKGDAKTAVKHYTEATSLVPGHALSHFHLGRALEATGQFAEAKVAYNRARDHDAQPSRHVSGFSRAIRRVAEQRNLMLIDAESLFEAASPHGLVGFNLIEDYSHPTPEGHRLVAKAIYETMLGDKVLGEPPPGAPAFEQAMTQSPKAPPVVDEANRRAAMLYNTGYVLATQGHYKEAMEKYEECLKINPFYFAARLNLGVLRYSTGNIEQSLRDFEEVLNYAPGNQQARVAKGWALLSLGRYAVEVFREATRHDPKDPQAWYGLGAAMQRQGGPKDEIETTFRKAIALEPQYGDALCALGELLLVNQRAPESVQHFEACVDTRPQNGRTRAWLGWALQTVGRRDEAITAYQTALRLDPGNPYAKQGLQQLGGALP